MVNVKLLLVGILFGLIAQVLTFLQLQGQMKWESFKNNYWIIVSIGIPISMSFMYSVKCMVLAFNGQMWPSRLIGFSIGAIVFTYLSWVLFSEPINIKTFICLLLAIAILIIQLFWK